jgi:hypothetical protein
MPNSYGEILTARGGSYILNDNNAWTGTAYAIDVLDIHVADKGTAVKAGAIITPMDIAIPFSEIELISGSIIIVLK